MKGRANEAIMGGIEKGENVGIERRGNLPQHKNK